jgi:hypothetical protein
MEHKGRTTLVVLSIAIGVFSIGVIASAKNNSACLMNPSRRLAASSVARAAS